MITRLFSALLLGLFFSFSAHAQEAMLEDIGRSIRAASSRELINYFGSSTKLQLGGDSTMVYSKSQAEQALRRFFEKYPAVEFNITVKGNTTNGFIYQIGQYTTETESYRVYMLLKQVGGTYYIDTLSFSLE